MIHDEIITIPKSLFNRIVSGMGDDLEPKVSWGNFQWARFKCARAELASFARIAGTRLDPTRKAVVEMSKTLASPIFNLTDGKTAIVRGNGSASVYEPGTEAGVTLHNEDFRLLFAMGAYKSGACFDSLTEQDSIKADGLLKAADELYQEACGYHASNCAGYHADDISMGDALKRYKKTRDSVVDYHNPTQTTSGEVCKMISAVAVASHGESTDELSEFIAPAGKDTLPTYPGQPLQEQVKIYTGKEYGERLGIVEIKACLYRFGGNVFDTLSRYWVLPLPFPDDMVRLIQSLRTKIEVKPKFDSTPAAWVDAAMLKLKTLKPPIKSTPFRSEPAAEYRLKDNIKATVSGDGKVSFVDSKMVGFNVVTMSSKEIHELSNDLVRNGFTDGKDVEADIQHDANKTFHEEIFTDPTIKEKVKLARFDVLFTEVAKDAFDNAKAHGFHPENEKRNVPEMLCLIHSEVSECLAFLRHNNPPDDHIPTFTGAEAELADVIIRIMDLAHLMGWRVGAAVGAKMAYNKSRPFKHGKAL